MKKTTALSLTTQGVLDATLTGDVKLAEDKMPLNLQLKAKKGQYAFADSLAPLKINEDVYKRQVQSTVPSQQALLDQKALQDWADETQWLGLDIVKTETLTKTQSAVEFKAHFQGSEQPQVHHEHSLFVKIEGRWYFIDPTVPLPSNKQPCICGSGKKFKHCCGDLL